MRVVLAVLAVAALGCSGGGGGGTGGGTGGSGGGTGGGTGGPITVAGKVVDTAGKAVAGATVVVIGKPAATADMNGQFSIASVTPPYDLAQVTVAGAQTYITVYKALTRADPTVLSLSVNVPSNNGMVSGTVTGVTFPLPAAQRFTTAFSSAEAHATTSPGMSQYSMGFGWNGPATTTGSVHALHWSVNALGQPVDFLGYGKIDNVLVAGGTTATMKNVVVMPVSEQILMGSLTVPTGFAPTGKVATLIFTRAGLYSGIGIGSDGTGATAFSFTTPVIQGTTVDLTFEAEGSGTMAGRRTLGAKRSVAGNATGVTMTLPGPPGLSLPVDAVTGLNLGTQSFSWSHASPAAMYLLQVTINGRIFAMFTSETSATLPPTTELGLGTFPASTGGRWTVSAYNSAPTNIDAFAGAANPYEAIIPVASDVVYSNAGERTFTTQ